MLGRRQRQQARSDKPDNISEVGIPTKSEPFAIDTGNDLIRRIAPWRERDSLCIPRYELTRHDVPFGERITHRRQSGAP